MGLIGKALDDISAADIVEEVSRPSELDRLDFKSDSYDALGAKELRKLRIDIVALANHAGGWIVCGVSKDATGKYQVSGIQVHDAEAHQLRLAQIIESDDKIQPKIDGVDVRAFDLAASNLGKVILIFVPKSGNSPHWALEDTPFGKFYTRQNAANKPMTYDDIRQGFMETKRGLEVSRQFRLERLDEIERSIDARLPIGLGDNVRLVTHVFPINFDPTEQIIDISAIATPLLSFNMNSNLSTYPTQYTSDGAFQVLYQLSPSHVQRGYIQVFRTGAIECVHLLMKSDPYGKPTNEFNLWEIEKTLLEDTAQAFNLSLSLLKGPPVVIFPAITNLDKDTLLHVPQLDRYRGREYVGQGATRSRLAFAHFVIETRSFDAKPYFKLAFDMLWNTAGFPGSESYDTDGKWTNLRYS
jgi:hypothetical protein